VSHDSDVTTREVVVGVGSAARMADDIDVLLDLGPHHPTSHGMLSLRLSLEHDRVVDADVHAHHLHRGAEKLFEVRDYRQATLLANRHDWLSAFANELGVALAAERLLGIAVPRRATIARTAVVETTRVAHHLAFLIPAGWPRRADAERSAAAAVREACQQLLESATGGRLHTMTAKIGGLRQDVPASWTDELRGVMLAVPGAIDELRSRLQPMPGAPDPAVGLGRLDRAAAQALGVSGPVARASGVDLDLRRDDPSLAYPELADALRVVTRTTGDARARIDVLLDETVNAAELAIAAAALLDAAGPGPVNVPLPKVVRLPEGTTHAWIEAPGGINGYLLVSRGGTTPWARRRSRTARRCRTCCEARRWRRSRWCCSRCSS
jgi:NADH-quinone oxidoreductase subunit D